MTTHTVGKLTRGYCRASGYMFRAKGDYKLVNGDNMGNDDDKNMYGGFAVKGSWTNLSIIHYSKRGHVTNQTYLGF